MDEEIDRLVVSVRADTRGFARDIAEIRASLDGPLAGAAAAAGRGIENALLGAVRTGKFSFDDLRKTALSVLSEIASTAIRTGFDVLAGGDGSGGGGGLGGLLSRLFGGAPGRATGGPVSPGRAYVVGERGPELFVPTTSGQIATTAPGGGRDVRVAISINANGGEGARALAQSSRQVARAVKAAIDGVQG
ncbi:MAG: tail tape measure protein [Sphingomonas sp.]|jgi:phage-related minor tail protein